MCFKQVVSIFFSFKITLCLLHFKFNKISLEKTNFYYYQKKYINSLEINQTKIKILHKKLEVKK
jgi:hypothetical protein